ncbi:MAG: glycosyl transferase family 2 [Ilumatobacteraceae bacterium]|nr:glycosyl transferase family 2 [Ilumatobacteraceae bacterium]
MHGPSIGIVVPCFDEAARLDIDRLLGLLERPRLVLHFVDDGSTDGTGARLVEAQSRAPDRIRIHTLAWNRGKAEAVRTGLIAACAEGHAITGYFDADLATPTADLLRLIDAATAEPTLITVLASRVGLLGHRIVRSRRRHYLGRLFATASSLLLHLPVYDTQCGAKVFRVGPQLESAIAEPFVSRWAFDVELLGRLGKGRAGVAPVPVTAMLEVPVWEWSDVAGSRLDPVTSLRTAAELWTIRRRLATWR